MTPIRVVIADDHALVREGVRRVLEESGMAVVGEAADGDEATQMVEQLRPDVVLMDIAMPRVNGIEATRRIKARSPSTPVLILTAYDDDIYIFTLLEAGAAGYLLKDVQAAELVRAVKAVASGEPVLSAAVARKVLGHFATGYNQPTRPQAADPLTSHERIVLVQAARGLSNKAIARQLNISPRTVQAHLAHIFDKLGVASRTEAVVVSLTRGLLGAEDIGDQVNP